MTTTIQATVNNSGKNWEGMNEALLFFTEDACGHLKQELIDFVKQVDVATPTELDQIKSIATQQLTPVIRDLLMDFDEAFVVKTMEKGYANTINTSLNQSFPNVVDMYVALTRKIVKKLHITDNVLMLKLNLQALNSLLLDGTTPSSNRDLVSLLDVLMDKQAHDLRVTHMTETQIIDLYVKHEFAAEGGGQELFKKLLSALTEYVQEESKEKADAVIGLYQSCIDNIVKTFK